MYLRKLAEKDAIPMLEWMHDQNVVGKMAAEVVKMTLKDCHCFIQRSNEDETITLNRAICTDEDDYLGTVSLKNISYADENAEYAIIMKSSAMGTGAAKFATMEILRIAFEELKLHKVYLYVKSSNIRAIKFYEKIGFRYEGTFVEHVKNREGKYEDLIWFAISADEFATWTRQ